MFNKILLAADGSEHSLRAAEKAVELAQYSTESVVHIVYVVDEDDAKTDVLHHWNEGSFSLKRKELIAPVEEKMKSASVPYTTKIIHGNPGPSIVKYANDEAFDIVIVGSRGLNTLQEFVLGSVSHKIAKRADCSVLIVK